MGSDLPKQFICVGGKPVLMWTLEAFHRYDAQMTLILVLPQSQQAFWRTLCDTHGFTLPHCVAAGGETRFHSVQNGLAWVEEEGLVAVHDGVRPFVSQEVIDGCFRLAALRRAVVPVVDVVDTVRQLTDEGSRTVDRSSYKLVQTPQVFDAMLLKQAYSRPYSPSFTDDASVVEAFGVPVALAEGNRENIKITTPFDLKIASALLAPCSI